VKAYDQSIAAFIAPFAERTQQDAVVACYHEVRNFDYVSDGVRDPHMVLARRAGSCSGKHIVLRDSLRALGANAWIETVEGDFAAGIPEHSSMSDELLGYVREGKVRDFHQFVVWAATDGDRRLDATWPDSLCNLGFEGNADWRGNDDTRLALTPERFCGPTDDIKTSKAGMIDRLSTSERGRREAFLTAFSAWIAESTKSKGGTHVQ
jgi:hypothetical protein